MKNRRLWPMAVMFGVAIVVTPEPTPAPQPAAGTQLSGDALLRSLCEGRENTSLGCHAFSIMDGKREPAENDQRPAR